MYPADLRKPIDVSDPLEGPIDPRVLRQDEMSSIAIMVLRLSTQ